MQTLGNFWDSFEEASAFGVKVDMPSNSRNNQFCIFTPTLSGVEIFADIKKQPKI
jgi:hypothetical protein